jgi:hypothetical protein
VLEFRGVDPRPNAERAGPNLELKQPPLHDVERDLRTPSRLPLVRRQRDGVRTPERRLLSPVRRRGYRRVDLEGYGRAAAAAHAEYARSLCLPSQFGTTEWPREEDVDQRALPVRERPRGSNGNEFRNEIVIFGRHGLKPYVAASGCRPVAVLPSPPSPTARRAAMAMKRQAEELLLIEEADAWFEYLEATRGQSELRYREIEPWAWARLRQRLRAVRTRRAKLKPAAAA